MSLTQVDLLYIYKLGVYVGEFTQEQVKNGICDKVIDKFKEITGNKYINFAIDTNFYGEDVIRYWVCKKEDVQDLMKKKQCDISQWEVRKND